MKRRTLLQALPAATLLPASLWAASQQDNANSMPATTAVYELPAAMFLPASLWATSQQDNDHPVQGSTKVYELRVYQAAPGKLAELLVRFREQHFT